MEKQKLKKLITNELWDRRMSAFESDPPDREKLKRLRNAVMVPFEEYASEYERLEKESVYTGKLLVKQMIDSRMA